MNREPSPPGMVAAAEQEYHAMRDQLTVLLPLVRALAGEFTEVQTVADIWLTLRSRDRRAAALLGATAIVQLAKRRDHGAPMATEPGS